MRFLSILAIAAAVISAQSYGVAQDDDHLWPEPSVYSDPILLPDEYIFQRLEEVFEPNIRARALVYPSGRPEFAVAIRENIELAPVSIEEQTQSKKSTYDLLFLTFEHRLFDFETLADLKSGAIKVFGEDGSLETDQQAITDLEAKLPASMNDVELFKCEKEIDPELAEAVLHVWKKMLLQTRYSENQPQQFHRGNTYHFAYEENFLRLFGYPTSYAGYAHGPVAGTKTRQFTKITGLLRDFCSVRNSEKSVLLLEEVRKLDDRLNANN